MPRPPDPDRRERLLAAAVDYAVANGVSGLTLRPLADALGVRPNTLVHHFGSKEELLSAILNGVRDRLREMRAAMRRDPSRAWGRDPMLGVWAWTADPERQPFFRFFFEAYGLALRDPERFRPFLERVVSDWLPESDSAEATLELAVLRGLLLDLLTTGDRERVEQALALFRGGGSPAAVAGASPAGV